MEAVETTLSGAVQAPLGPETRPHLAVSLTTRAQLDEVERIRANAARVWAMRGVVLRRSDLLSESFARELHRRMFGGIWRGAGRYRTSGAGSGWDPGRIPEGVRMLLDDAEGWIRSSTYPVHEAAVRLHHRLIVIRPWENGNGRHARLLADVIVAASGEEPLGWGAASPGGVEAVRARYQDAIRAADRGDPGPLLAFARG